MGVTFPNESPAYRAARNKLLQREVALRREMEAWPRRSSTSTGAAVPMTDDRIALRELLEKSGR